MIIEKIRSEPSFQIIWTLLLVLALICIYYFSEAPEFLQLSPFFQDESMRLDAIWKRITVFSISFVLVFVSLISLSNLLRNYNFTGDSRMEMLFLLLPILLLNPSLFYRLDLCLFIFFLQRALKVQFDIHTQITIKREIVYLALYMSMAAVFYPNSILVAAILYFGILAQRGFYLKEFLIYLILLALPFYFIFSILYLLDLPNLYAFEWDYHLPRPIEFNNQIIARIIFSAFFLVLLFRSVLLNSKAILRSKAQFRNLYVLLFLGILFYLFTIQEEGIAIAFLPIFAVFAHSYTSFSRKWILELILCLISLLSLSFILGY